MPRHLDNTLTAGGGAAPPRRPLPATRPYPPTPRPPISADRPPTLVRKDPPDASYPQPGSNDPALQEKAG
jgi:hypothetical protein